MPASRSQPKVIILGGGFGGAYCARGLRGAINQFDADVLLLDRNNYFIFSPLLVEAGTGSLEPRHAIVPIRQFLTRSMRFRMAEVVGIDPEKRQVHYHMIGDETVRSDEYDHLVIALGSVTRLPNVPGLRERAFEMKTLADSVALRDRAIQMLELANAVTDDAQRKALLHYVVVGSNFTGVEVAGEFLEFLRGAARRYRNLKPTDCNVTIIERAPRILSVLDEDLANYAARQLRKSGIRILLGNSVKELRHDAVLLEDGETLAAHTLVWCGGIAENPLAAKLPFPHDERGYLQCERDLRVKGYDNVWAIGDCAANPGPDGRPYPATAQHATRQGTHAARNIERVLRGDAPTPCNLQDFGSLAALGCRTAVAKLLGFKLSGFAAWWLWRTVYLMKMPTLSRKIRVTFDWTMDLFFSRDYVQLGIHRKEPETSVKESP